jgi:hypothetical protein
MPPAPDEPRPGGPVCAGWKEFVALPDWGVRRLRAKLDTGARTSVLDVARCDLERVGGALTARLHVALSRRRPGRAVVVEAPVLGLVVVTNSGGTPQQRPVVEATLRLGPVERRIRLTPADRSGMRFRMLLGREALAGAVVVDVGSAYLLGRP